MPRVRKHGDAPDDDFQGYSSDASDGTTDSFQMFPDVPLNPQHRFCTPPPLDPQFADPPAPEKDDFPQYLSRPPSPDDFDELTGARPPLPSLPGSEGNPIVIEDDTSGPGPKRRTRGSLRPLPSTSQGPSSQAAATPSQVTRRTSPRKTSSKAQKSSLNPEVLKKPVHGFSPTKSSPLSKVAYRAPSEILASPALHPRA